MTSFTNLPAAAAFSKALYVLNKPIEKPSRLRANHISVMTAVMLLTKDKDYTTMHHLWNKLGKGMIRSSYDVVLKYLVYLVETGHLSSANYVYRGRTFIHYSLTIKGNNTLHDLNKLINKYKKPRK